MKLIFYVKKCDPINQSKVITVLSTVKFQMEIDYIKNIISVEILNPDDIENIIDLVNKCFEIEKTVINNKNNNGEKIITNRADENKDISCKHGFFYDCDINFGEDIENNLNYLIKSIEWLKKNTDADTSVISRYIKTARQEMRLQLNNKVIEFSVGDIVDVYYGAHLHGEGIKEKTISLVVKVYKDLVYVVPLPALDKHSPYRNMILKSGIDFEYDINYKKKDPQLVVDTKYGKYVNSKRIIEVAGKVSEKSFEEVLKYLTEKNCFYSEKKVSNIDSLKKSSENSSEKNSIIVREYLNKKMNSDMKKNFTLKELYDKFPEINKSTISSIIYLEKKKGNIISTNRGGYRFKELM